MDTFGKRLKHARLHALSYRKMTQQELADKIGYNRKSVANWEMDLFIPNAEGMKRIANVCHVDLLWLMYGEGKGGDISAKEKRNTALPGTAADASCADFQKAD